MGDTEFQYYLITDRKACAPRALTEVVKEACQHGIKAVQLREKDLSGRQLFELAHLIRKITLRFNTKLFINDRVDIALSVGADGVHCRENSLSPAIIKSLKQDLIVGASVHSLKRAKKASTNGADFLLFGPIFYTPSKASYGKPQGTEFLNKVTEAVDIPVYAVGGIDPDRAKTCLKAGAAGVAGISSFMGSSSIDKTAKRWKEVIGEL